MTKARGTGWTHWCVTLGLALTVWTFFDRGTAVAQPLNGLASASGGVWVATSNLAQSADGVVTVNSSQPASASHPIPRVRGTIRVHGILHPAGAGFVGLALGRPGLGITFWQPLDVLAYVRDDGGWGVSAGSGAKTRLAAGTAADYGGWTAGGSVPVDLALDTISNRVSLTIAGHRVLDARSLPPEATPAEPPAAAGFRFQEPVRAGGPSINGFAVQTTVSISGGLAPSASDTFYVTADQAATLRWQAESVAPDRPLAYALLDYGGRCIADGLAQVASNGAVTAEIRVPSGYYDLRFPDNGEVFGVVALAARAGAPDPYFGMDAGLTWLAADPVRRAEYVRAMKRVGIAIARERLNLGTVNPAPGKWNWESAGRPHDSVRKLYAEAGIPVLEPFWGQAKHLGIAKGMPYPQDPAACVPLWRAIAGRYSANWQGVELWNEPDLIPIPADQYVPVAKIVAWANRAAAVQAPIVGGVFAGASADYLRVCATNGLLDCCDAISFHTYYSLADLEGIVARLRAWMKAGGGEALPLWCTEAGLPWGPGAGRAPAARDAQTALAIAGNAIEGRAVGLARYMPFCLPPWRHGSGDNYGMTAQDGTPLRSMAAYVQAITALSGMHYVGDLDVPGTVRARVFGNGRACVAVLVTATIDTGATVRVAAPVLRLAGIDGRALTARDGGVPVPDGLTYAWLDPAATRFVKTDTPAAGLWALGHQAPAPRSPASPIVLQNTLDLSRCRYSAQRYLVDEATARALPLTVRAWNLSAAPQQVTLRLTLPGGETPADAVRQVAIPATGSVAIAWTVDASRALDVAEVRFATVAATPATGPAVPPLAMPFMVEGRLETHVARHAAQERLPIEDLARWHRNMPEGATFSTSATGQVFRFDCAFSGGQTWVFPRFALQQPLAASRYDGLLLRARVLKPARHMGLILRYDDRPGFAVSDMLPADGAWHVIYLPFAEFAPEPGNPETQNAILHIERVAWLSIGFVSNQADDAMEISDLVIVGNGRP